MFYYVNLVLSKKQSAAAATKMVFFAALLALFLALAEAQNGMNGRGRPIIRLQSWNRDMEICPHTTFFKRTY